VTAVSTGDRSGIHTGPADARDSHVLVFQAERSRISHKVIDLTD
jgi:hypothetical protein